VLLNSIPAFPLDGGRAVIAAIWSVFGLRRGVHWGAWIGLLASSALIVWAVWISNFIFALFAVYLLVQSAQALAAIRAEQSEVFGYYLSYGKVRSTDGWWQRFCERRAERASERAERTAAEESALLDRLLEKVSNEGLPSLTSGERSQLERISRLRRERENVG
jgi:hypothetical protein